MPLRDILKKRDKIKEDGTDSQASTAVLPPTEFVIMRSDTNTQELIQPPSFAEEDAPPIPSHESHSSKIASRFRSSSTASTTSKASSKGEKRLSQRLHLRSASRASSFSSIIPEDLPSIEDGAIGSEEKEAKWEERATILAKGNANMNQPTAVKTENVGLSCHGSSGSRPQISRSISDAKGDVRVGTMLAGNELMSRLRKPYKRLSNFMKPKVRKQCCNHSQLRTLQGENKTDSTAP